MERTIEKLGKFSEMVMQDAYRKKKERVRQAEKEKQEIIASSEIQYLQKAYEKIQDAVRRFEKQYNEEISKAVVESKEAMFNRRDEIIGSVFANVKKRLEEFVREKDYPVWIEKALGSALREAGEGKISVTVDEEDLELFKEIRTRLGADFDISESDEPVIGGFLVIEQG
jgi:vacuolar-type H+-ATPase subunit E/Vma4